MPPPPVFKTSRAQQTAVAVLMGVFLLCATALAYVQAGDDKSLSHTPTRLTEPQSDNSSNNQVMLIDTPGDWQKTIDEPGHLVATDPDRPTRSISLTTLRLTSRTAPQDVLKQFITENLPADVLYTLDAATQPTVFKLPDNNITAAQYMGISRGQNADGTPTQQVHMIACLTQDGYAYGTIYINDTPAPGEDIMNVLHADARLLSTICLSVRVEPK